MEMNTAKQQREDVGQLNPSMLIYVISLVVYLIANILDMTIMGFSEENGLTVVGLFTKLARYLSYAMCVFKIVYDNIFKRKHILYIVVATGILLFSYVGSADKMMILYLLFFVAARGVNSDLIIKVYFITQSVLLGLIVVCSQVGVIQDYIRVEGNRVRHFLGFSWTTTGAILFLFILLQYIYMKKGDINIKNSVILVGISAYFYIMTDSRFAFVVCFASVFFFLVFKKYVRKGALIKNIKKLLPILPFLIAIFAILLHYLYNPNNPLYHKINDLLSGRLRLGQNALNNFGISLTGQPIEWVGYNISEKLKGTYNYVDCSYIQILLDHGMVFILMLLALYGVLLYYSYNNKKYYLTWIIIIVLLFSITEPRLCNITFNPFVILAISESFEGRKDYEKTRR